MADLNKLAILVNQADDLQEFADDLEIEADIIRKAFLFGERSLTRNDNLELQEKLSRFERTRLDDFQQAELEDYADTLNTIGLFIDDTDNAQTFTQAVAENKVSLDDLQSAFLFFGQGDSTPKVQRRIIEWLNEDGNTADTFLSLFDADGQQMNEYGEQSTFWAWFRETFYK